MQVRRNLKEIQNSIAATEERYLTQPDISASVYKKVITALKIEEANLNTQIAELSANDLVIWEKHDLILSSIADVQGAFNGFAIPHKHRFVREVFDNSLSYAGGVYRTPYLHSLFRHNELILRDKRLLFVEQPVRKLGEKLRCARDEIRTHTPFRALPPQSSASTNFATHAKTSERKAGGKNRIFWAGVAGRRAIFLGRSGR